MAACELGPEVEGQLERLAEADHLGLLLGAGASVAAGLPGWDELALRLLNRAGAIGDADTARAYLASQDPTLAAEAARAATEDWHGVMHAALYGDPVADLHPGSLHLAAAYLAAVRPRRVSLLTLNIDDVLEGACATSCPIWARTRRCSPVRGLLPALRTAHTRFSTCTGCCRVTGPCPRRAWC